MAIDLWFVFFLFFSSLSVLLISGDELGEKRGELTSYFRIIHASQGGEIYEFIVSNRLGHQLYSSIFNKLVFNKVTKIFLVSFE